MFNKNLKKFQASSITVVYFFNPYLHSRFKD